MDVMSCTKCKNEFSDCIAIGCPNAIVRYFMEVYKLEMKKKRKLNKSSVHRLRENMIVW